MIFAEFRKISQCGNSFCDQEKEKDIGFPAVLLLPGAAMLLARKILEKSFVRIMSEEDLALEQERNRVWNA